MTNPAAQERLSSLDVLRGFAIVGTLGTNIWVFTAASTDLGRLREEAEAFTASHAGALWASLDTAVPAVTAVLTNGKFLALLSIMCGVGAGWTRRSAPGTGAGPPPAA